MNAVRMVWKMTGLNRALLLCGASKKAWYYASRPRNVSPDPEVQETVQKIGPERSTYGTRRMAAQISRELNRPSTARRYGAYSGGWAGASPRAPSVR